MSLRCVKMDHVPIGPFRMPLGRVCQVLTGPCSVKSENASTVAVFREWWMLTWRTISFFSHETTEKSAAEQPELWVRGELTPIQRRFSSCSMSVRCLCFGHGGNKPCFCFFFLGWFELERQQVGERIICGLRNHAHPRYLWHLAGL